MAAVVADLMPLAVVAALGALIAVVVRLVPAAGDAARTEGEADDWPELDERP